jgi:hypothetical protein
MPATVRRNNAMHFGMARYNPDCRSINARNDDGKMMKNGLLKLVLFSGMISLAVAPA